MPPFNLTAIDEPSNPSHVEPSPIVKPSTLISTETVRFTKQDKSPSQEPQSLGISQEPSSSVAPVSKLHAAGSVQPNTASTGQGDVCIPKLDQSFCSRTIHSESSALVPAEMPQLLAFPCTTEHLRTNVWSLVPLATPATSQPLPGSPFQSPTMSRTIYPPTSGVDGEVGSKP